MLLDWRNLFYAVSLFKYILYIYIFFTLQFTRDLMWICVSTKELSSLQLVSFRQPIQSQEMDLVCSGLEYTCTGYTLSHLCQSMYKLYIMFCFKLWYVVHCSATYNVAFMIKSICYPKLPFSHIFLNNSIVRHLNEMWKHFSIKKMYFSKHVVTLT